MAALVFLRGRDADGRLRGLRREKLRMQPLLGALAVAMVERRAYEPLHFRCLGDWSRERIGVGDRAVREWARVWRALRELPRLRRAVIAGEVSWTVARRVVGLVTPENEEACLATVRGRTVRAVETIVRAVEAAERKDARTRMDVEPDAEEDDEERTTVREPCTPSVGIKWEAAVELARRMAGEQLPVSAAAELIVAEVASAVGCPEVAEAPGGDQLEGGARHALGKRGRDGECGLRAERWPWLRWGAPGAGGRSPAPETADGSGARDASASSGEASGSDASDVASDCRAGAPDGSSEEWEALARELATAEPLELDRRFREAIAFLQRADHEIGRVLRQVLDRRLYRELGFESFDRYVVERLDLSGRTARRLVRIARAEHGTPEAARVATAFREGRITLLQAESLLRGAGTVAEADRVTLRGLRDREPAPSAEVVFDAPPEVARLFRALVARVGLEAMLDHAIATWVQAGRQFRDYADFERDDFRCTAPACSARRGLESHHIRFLSAGGPDVSWNRTTLCAFHHRRCVHGDSGSRAGRMRIRGRAPDGLVFELGVGRFASGDVKLESWRRGVDCSRGYQCDVH